MIKVTRRDVMANALVDPIGWYDITVSKIEGKAAKDGSANTVFTFKFRREDLKDMYINPLYLNEKGIFGNGLEFLIACGLPADTIEKIRKKEMDEVEIDETKLQGMNLRANITHRTYEGKTSNEASGFLPAA